MVKGDAMGANGDGRPQFTCERDQQMAKQSGAVSPRPPRSSSTTRDVVRTAFFLGFLPRHFPLSKTVQPLHRISPISIPLFAPVLERLATTTERSERPGHPASLAHGLFFLFLRWGGRRRYLQPNSHYQMITKAALYFFLLLLVRQREIAFCSKPPATLTTIPASDDAPGQTKRLPLGAPPFHKTSPVIAQKTPNFHTVLSSALGRRGIPAVHLRCDVGGLSL
jgi:hypothetical protein